MTRNILGMVDSGEEAPSTKYTGDVKVQEKGLSLRH